MPDVLLAPYIPITESARVGAWALVPFRELGESEALPKAMRDPVLRLVEAYRLPSSGGAVLGAVVYPADGEVGSPFERSAMSALRRALLAGVIADNPTMAVDDDAEPPNAGHSIATSENALLYGHPLGDGESYVIQTGVLARRARYSARLDEPLPKVDPPVELPRPMFGGFDAEMADATNGALAVGDVAARRLHRALDWYVVAFSNAEAVSHDVRVGAARSALEVLTDSGDASKKLVRAVGRLLREDDTTEQTHRSRFWDGPVQLTADEWWLARFCELRNAIVHGDEVAEDRWMHEGHHHRDHAHDALIRCLKATVAAHAKDPLLRLKRSERVFPRITQEMVGTLRDERGNERPADL